MNLPFVSLGTQRTVRPLSPASEKKIIDTLRKMVEYYKYHGINLRTCYEDFDVHHIGKITESQVWLWLVVDGAQCTALEAFIKEL